MLLDSKETVAIRLCVSSQNSSTLQMLGNSRRFQPMRKRLPLSLMERSCDIEYNQSLDCHVVGERLLRDNLNNQEIQNNQLFVMIPEPVFCCATTI